MSDKNDISKIKELIVKITSCETRLATILKELSELKNNTTMSHKDKDSRIAEMKAEHALIKKEMAEIPSPKSFELDTDKYSIN